MGNSARSIHILHFSGPFQHEYLLGCNIVAGYDIWCSKRTFVFPGQTDHMAYIVRELCFIQVLVSTSLTLPFLAWLLPLVLATDCKTATVGSPFSTCFDIYTNAGLTAAQFSANNPGLNCSLLQNGQKVCISPGTLPSESPIPSQNGTCAEYVVVPQDSCSAIGLKFHITVAQIESFNTHTFKWKGCASLQIGQVMCISPGNPPPIPYILHAFVQLDSHKISSVNTMWTREPGKCNMSIESVLQCFWVLWYHRRFLHYCYSPQLDLVEYTIFSTISTLSSILLALEGGSASWN
ncbi:hypothetical protein BDZ94DRAFT_1299088 [Collybia nuda]|uniref:LysM domain-containing protein n=1 Tax=Collybia nuda TaxID=64659 RepID=A0A9P5Y5N3_9AGAR|nr:hypothetical protein BDZ94DRAFT_1299088 [Collybia nuda]